MWFRVSLAAGLAFACNIQLCLADSVICSNVEVQRQGNNAKETVELCRQGPNALKGLHWGLGILYSQDLGGIGEAVLIDSGGNKRVRVSKESSSAARAAFELHYFFKPQKSTTLDVDWAWGPFVSLNTKPLDNLNGGQTFSSIGIGLMVGANAYVGDNLSHSINFGLGWLVDTDVKRLAPGVEDGMITTLTQDQLTVKTTRSGLMGIISYNFTLN